MYDPAIYEQELDDENLEIKAVLDKLEELTKKENNKWFCEICDVRCFSEDFYMNHMKGMKHKRKEEEKKRTQTKPTKPGHDKNPPKQDNEKKTPGHDKNPPKQDNEKKKKNTRK